MGTAMTEWGCNITEAAQLAADVVGYSAQVIRGWAYSYFTSFSQMIRITPENVTDEDIEAQLSSGRGLASPHPQSLLFDEEFQLNAQTYPKQCMQEGGAQSDSSSVCRLDPYNIWTKSLQ